MSIIGMIVIFVFAAVVFIVLNHGTKDKNLKRREIYWARFEGK